MRNVLTSSLVTAALMGAATPTLADSSLTYYAATNPRIIQVQPLPRDIDDDEDVPPVRPQRVVKPAPKPVAMKEPVRRKPFNVPVSVTPPPEPEPVGPRRALLSAPPPLPTSSIHDGPTPLRPTPRFGQPLPDPAPEPLTTFTPPPPSIPAPTAAAHQGDDDNEDHLPPPGDPRLAPPEPAQ